jgi:hypothetical protein
VILQEWTHDTVQSDLINCNAAHTWDSSDTANEHPNLRGNKAPNFTAKYMKSQDGRSSPPNPTLLCVQRPDLLPETLSSRRQIALLENHTWPIR